MEGDPMNTNLTLCFKNAVMTAEAIGVQMD